jgi:hypothetical protein
VGDQGHQRLGATKRRPREAVPSVSGAAATDGEPPRPPSQPPGNYAGQLGAILAYMVGLYDDQPTAVAADAASVWDVVPSELLEGRGPEARWRGAARSGRAGGPPRLRRTTK